MNEILKLAQQGKMPNEIAKELDMHQDHVYRYTPPSWYADPRLTRRAYQSRP